jgi:hypothetical protein
MCTQINTYLNINVAFISVWYDSVTKIWGHDYCNFIFRPDLIEWRSVRTRVVRERLENAFHVAEREYGVTRLLDPEGENTSSFFFLRKTSRCATSVPIKCNTLCTSSTTTLLHVRLHVLTLVIGHFQAFLQLCLHCSLACNKVPYIIESNLHPNLIRTSLCQFLKRKKS